MGLYYLVLLIHAVRQPLQSSLHFFWCLTETGHHLFYSILWNKTEYCNTSSLQDLLWHWFWTAEVIHTFCFICCEGSMTLHTVMSLIRQVSFWFACAIENNPWSFCLHKHTDVSHWLQIFLDSFAWPDLMHSPRQSNIQAMLPASPCFLLGFAPSPSLQSVGWKTVGGKKELLSV